MSIIVSSTVTDGFPALRTCDVVESRLQFLFRDLLWLCVHIEAQLDFFFDSFIKTCKFNASILRGPTNLVLDRLCCMILPTAGIMHISRPGIIKAFECCSQCSVMDVCAREGPGYHFAFAYHPDLSNPHWTLWLAHLDKSAQFHDPIVLIEQDLNQTLCRKGEMWNNMPMNWMSSCSSKSFTRIKCFFSGRIHAQWHKRPCTSSMTGGVKMKLMLLVYPSSFVRDNVRWSSSFSFSFGIVSGLLVISLVSVSSSSSYSSSSESKAFMCGPSVLWLKVNARYLVSIELVVSLYAEHGLFRK